MRTLVAAGLISIVTGVVVWLITTFLAEVDPFWGLLIAIGTALVSGFGALLLLRRQGMSGRRDVASNLSSRKGGVVVRDIRVGSKPGTESQTASGIRARDDVSVERVTDE